MRLLLDTHILIWAMGTPERLGASLRDVRLIACSWPGQSGRDCCGSPPDPVVARYPGPVRHRDSF